MPIIRDIITLEHPHIRKVSSPVERFHDAHIQNLIDDMILTMYEKDGIGLAAPQVHEPVKIIVIVPDPKNFELYKKSKSDALVMINPVITRHSLLKESGEEGCLSVPNYWGSVKRWKKVTAIYYDRAGEKKKIHAEGLLARIIQHEIDHLDGILFIDRATTVHQIQQL
jgi:peptide deformylase